MPEGPLDPTNYEPNDVPLEQNPVNQPAPPPPLDLPEGHPFDVGNFGGSGFLRGLYGEDIAHPITAYLTARQQDYSWPEIMGHIATYQDRAAQFGYSQDDADKALGYNTTALRDSLGGAIMSAVNQEGAHPIEGATDGWVKPSNNPERPFTLNNTPDTVRFDYANALMRGETKGPQDFVDNYLAATNRFTNVDLSPLKWGMAASLPTPQALVDYGLGVAQHSNFDTTKAPGMIAPGNLDPWNRPVLQNPDGTYSTTSSMSIGTDKGETLIPTVVNGERLSDEDAIIHFNKTGENLGVFDTPEHADDYASALHNAQASLYDQHGRALNATKNLADIWAQTGVPPDVAYQQSFADPFFREALVTPQQASERPMPTNNPLIGGESQNPLVRAFQEMEGSLPGAYLRQGFPPYAMARGFVDSLYGPDFEKGPVLSPERVGETIGRMMKSFVTGIPGQIEQGERVLAGGGTPQDKVDLAVQALMLSAGSEGSGFMHGNKVADATLVSKALEDGKPGPLADTLNTFKQTLSDNTGSILGNFRLSREPNFGQGAMPYSEMDMNLRRLTGSINAGSLAVERILHDVPDEWRGPAFQAKAHEQIETGLYTPGTQMARSAEGPLRSDDVNEYLQHFKPMTDAEHELGTRVAQKMDLPIKDLLTTDRGYVHRIWDQKELASLDPNVAMELTSGVIPANKLSTYAAGMQARSDNLYVFDHNDGRRVWGTEPLEKLGDNPDTKAPYKIGDTIEAPDGHTITIGRPTSKEMEANLGNFTALKNHMVATAINVDRLQKVDKVLDFISNTAKDLQDRGQFIPEKVANLPKGVTGEGFIKSDIPGLKGQMDPRIANVINDWWKSGKDGDLLNTLNRISSWIINPMFLDPIPHTWNMSNGYLLNRASDWLNPASYVRQIRALNKAVREIATRGSVYREHVAAGSGLPYASQAAQNFRNFIATKTLADMKADEGTWGAYANAIGVGLPDLYKGMQNHIHSAMWWLGDVMKFSRELEWRQRGYSLDDAIRLTEKDMVPYQIPSQILGSRFLSQVMKQPFISAFGRYHYGLVNSIAQFTKDITDPLRGKIDPQAFGDAVAKATIAGAVAYFQVPFMYNHGVSGMIDKAKDIWQGQKDWTSGVNAVTMTSALVNIFNLLHSGKDAFGNDIIQKKAEWPQKVAEGLKEASQFYWPAQVMVHGMDKGWGSVVDDLLGSTFYKAPPYQESARQVNEDQWKVYNQYNHPGFIQDMTDLLGSGSPERPPNTIYPTHPSSKGTITQMRRGVK